MPLCRRLSALYEVRGLVRVSGTHLLAAETNPKLQWVEIGDLNNVTDWGVLLRGVTTVIHLAARTHVLHEKEPDPLEAYRRINVAVTERLAKACVTAGVKRLVFLSSVKVNGESTLDRPFCESDIPQPQDAYGKSKLEAETVLKEIGNGSDLKTVIVRPPLVYGPGVKGNFLRLLDIARRGWPLPLASVQNLRSFIYVENLVTAIIACATHAHAPGKTYLVSDHSDLSTPELLRQLALHFGLPARIWPCPPRLLQGVAHLLGRGAEASRLLGSLQVDCSLIRSELGWTPPFSIAEGLVQTTHWHQKKYQ